MKAKELMIGDWVYEDGIAQIVEDLSKSDGINGYGEDRYSPIPLTGEILKANGYIHYLNIFEHPGAFDIHYRDCGFCFYGFDDDKYPIASVHELQHALRLCGLNDLADNFKLK